MNVWGKRPKVSSVNGTATITVDDPSTGDMSDQECKMFYAMVQQHWAEKDVYIPSIGEISNIIDRSKFDYLP
jgi:hypothetical protein